jgi:hypothetical protein
MTKHRFLIVLTAIAYMALLLPVPTSQGCINDRDTRRWLQIEGMIQNIKTNEKIVWAIVGRFEREPAAYYQMRIARSSKELEKDPTRLDLYDDIAAAHDRIGKSSEAIDWMTRKKVQLDKLEAFYKIGTDKELREQVYRYHANIGTFYAHRWLRGGANRKDISDMRTGHDHIVKAVKIKPNAHFNRERFQLDAMKWILDAAPNTDLNGLIASDLAPTNSVGDAPADPRPPTKTMASFLNVKNLKDEKKVIEAVEGLVGLIVLGNAWESVDIFYALAAALQEGGHTGPAALALMRCEELIDAGRKSLHPDMPDGIALKALIRMSLHAGSVVREMESDPNHYLSMWYTSARKNAKSWEQERVEFMTSQFDKGLHPDIDTKAFWTGYVEVAAVPLPTLPDRPAQQTDYTGVIVTIVLVTVSIGAFGLAFIILVRRRVGRTSSGPAVSA